MAYTEPNGRGFLELPLWKVETVFIYYHQGNQPPDSLPVFSLVPIYRNLRDLQAILELMYIQKLMHIQGHMSKYD